MAEKRVTFSSPWLPWLLIAPQLGVVTVFFLWPTAQALLQAFQQSDAFGTSVNWVGLENFVNLFNDKTYLASFFTTAIFSISVAALSLSVALILAVCADRVLKGNSIYKTFLIWPYAVAPAVAGTLWLFMFAPSVGIVSYVLRQMGVDWNHLLNANHAMSLIVLAAVWRQIPYNFIFFLAGLQSIPKSVIEAASIDGAGPVRRFWNMQLPLLSPMAFFLLVMNMVYAFFETFAIVDAATSGGPGKDTAILVYKVYFDGFKAMDLGGAAAQSVVLMAIVVVLTVFQFRYLERRVNY